LDFLLDLAIVGLRIYIVCPAELPGRSAFCWWDISCRK